MAFNDWILKKGGDYKMNYLANYDSNGEYLGFYPVKMLENYKDVPTPNIELAEEQHVEAMTGNFKVINGVHTYQPKVLSQEELINQHIASVQYYLDSTAKKRNYDGILSLCTYATSTDAQFAKEGQSGVVWRDSVWAKCYAILAEVKAGTRTTPTTDELLAELPLFNWGDK